MALVDAKRFADLKNRVRAECLRRCYSGSVADYGGTDFDYSAEPTKDQLIRTEHYTKLVVPLSKINEDDIPSLEGNRIISDAEMTQMEAAVTRYETRSMSDTTKGDCKSSCTGACHTACSSTCTGGCGQQCSGTCTGGCNGCSGCSGRCTGSCSGCGSGCSSGCSGRCTGGCKDSCTVTCGQQGCVGSCLGLCHNGCTSSCQKSCGYCGANCTGVSK